MIAFNAATLRLGGKTIVENLDLDVRPGESLFIVGASGCGKTTALRLAACLYRPTNGDVTFDGQPMLNRAARSLSCPDYGKALLPWRTASANISLVLGACGIPGDASAPVASWNYATPNTLLAAFAGPRATASSGVRSEYPSEFRTFSIDDGSDNRGDPSDPSIALSQSR